VCSEAPVRARQMFRSRLRRSSPIVTGRQLFTNALGVSTPLVSPLIRYGAGLCRSEMTDVRAQGSCRHPERSGSAIRPEGFGHVAPVVGNSALPMSRQIVPSQREPRVRSCASSGGQRLAWSGLDARLDGQLARQVRNQHRPRSLVGSLDDLIRGDVDRNRDLPGSG